MVNTPESIQHTITLDTGFLKEQAEALIDRQLTEKEFGDLIKWAEVSLRQVEQDFWDDGFGYMLGDWDGERKYRQEKGEE